MLYKLFTQYYIKRTTSVSFNLANKSFDQTAQSINLCKMQITSSKVPLKYCIIYWFIYKIMYLKCLNCPQTNTVFTCLICPTTLKYDTTLISIISNTRQLSLLNKICCLCWPFNRYQWWNFNLLWIITYRFSHYFKVSWD